MSTSNESGVRNQPVTDTLGAATATSFNARAKPPSETPGASETMLTLVDGRDDLTGYARVSTNQQVVDSQVEELRAAGCGRVYVDRGQSGTRQDRPGLRAALDHLRAGDTLVVWRLDRASRSVRHLLELSADLDARGVGLRSLTEQLDTSTPGGRLVFIVLAAVAAMERELIAERTLAGLRPARRRGARIGRTHALSALQRAEAAAMVASGRTIADVSRLLGCSRATVYRAVREDTAP